MELRTPDPLSLSGNVHENLKRFKKQWSNYSIGYELDKKDEKVQVAIFLNILGTDAEEILNTLIITDAQKKTVDGLLKVLTEFAKPKLNIAYCRYLFNTRDQQEGESFDQFYMAIRKLAEDCGFEKLRDSLIRDRIIIGIHNVQLRERLLGEELPLEKVVSLCLSVEAGKKRSNEVNQPKASSVDLVNSGRFQGNPSNQGNNFAGRARNNNSGQGRNNNFGQGYNHQSRYNSPNQQQPSRIIDCRSCGLQHPVRQCPAYRQQCKKCLGRNHFEKMCRINEVICPENSAPSVHLDEVEASDYVYISEISCIPHNFPKSFSNPPITDYNLSKCGKSSESEASAGRNQKASYQTHHANQSNHVNVNVVSSAETNEFWMQQLLVNNSFIDFKIDTGAEINILPWHLYQKVKTLSDDLVPNTTRVLGYGGAPIETFGNVTLKCQLPNTSVPYTIKFTVTKTGSTPLLSLQTSVQLGLIFKKQIDYVSAFTDEAAVLAKFPKQFSGVGEFPDVVDLFVSPNAIPSNDPPRRLPHKIRTPLRDKLNALQSLNIISNDVKNVIWFSNLVVVEKDDGSIRVCLDPNRLNKHIKRELFLIPSFEEIKLKLTNKKLFTVLDIKDGFWHCKLSPESTKYVGFHTPFGSFKFLRLPFGIICAPEIFQKVLTKYFGDIPNVIIYFDDILICGETEEEHDRAFAEVMRRAEELNIKFNKSKFQFKKTSINYMGHVLNQEGISPNPEYLEAILQLKNPNNRKELQSFLGSVNYVREYIPHLADLIQPFRGLLKKNSVFTWQQIHTENFNKIKEAVCAISSLANFNPAKKITLQCDASQFGLGACLLQEKRPIAFASRNLSDAECRYAQIEKELLSIVFGTKRFHNIVYGYKIYVENDHKPLEPSFQKNISQIMSNRLQRLLLKLLPYDLEVKYIPGKNMYLADLLSRNFLNGKPEDFIPLNEVVHCIETNFELSTPKFLELQKATCSDPMLERVKQMHLQDWNSCNDEALKPFYKIRHEIAMNNDIIYFKNRLIIPTELKTVYLKLLHGDSHLGISKTIEKAKLIVYWPTYIKDIENYIKACPTCSKFLPKNVKEPLISHTIPNLPFHKVGSDIAEFAGKSFLILTDYYSKWLEVRPMRNKTSLEVIRLFKEIFKIHGIPALVIADNQPFGSFELSQFAKQFNFKIQTSSPKYPQSNGMAENGVKRAKMLLRKVTESKGDLDLAILEYNNSPIPALGASPAQLLMNRVLRTNVPVSQKVLVPQIINVSEKMREHQRKTESHYNQSSKPKQEFLENEKIFIREQDDRWYPGRIIKKLEAPRSYLVSKEDGGTIVRNSKFLRKNYCNSRTENDVNPYLFYLPQGNTDNEHNINAANQVAPIQTFNLAPPIKNPTENSLNSVSSDDSSEITVIEPNVPKEKVTNEETESTDEEDFLGFETEPSTSTPKEVININKNSPFNQKLRHGGRGIPKKLGNDFVRK